MLVEGWRWRKQINVSSSVALGLIEGGVPKTSPRGTVELLSLTSERESNGFKPSLSVFGEAGLFPDSISKGFVVGAGGGGGGGIVGSWGLISIFGESRTSVSNGLNEGGGGGGGGGISLDSLIELESSSFTLSFFCMSENGSAEGDSVANGSNEGGGGGGKVLSFLLSVSKGSLLLSFKLFESGIAFC